MTPITMNTNASSALTRAQRRELEQDLRGEQARLERLMRDANGGPAERARPAPMAVDDGHAGLTVLLHGRAADRYQAVLNALERMDGGGYGICVSCQQAIPFGRLLAMPEAATCVTCSARG